MTNGRVVEAERPTMTSGLFEPRSPLEALGPLRGSSAFSSPLWQVADRPSVSSEAETPIDELSGSTPDPAGSDVDHDAGSGVDFDAPTETFPGVLLANTSASGSTGTVGSSEGTAGSEPRSFPWPPSPWPRNATSPTVRIRVADLRSGLDDDADPTPAEVPGPNDESAAPPAPPAPVTLSCSPNARTLVLAAIASLAVLCGGALFVGPMGAVTIAPDAGPTSAAGAPRVSGASVVPAALLAGAPAPAYPVSIEKLDTPKPAPAAKPAGPAGDAAMSGIPGMMGTPVPLSTPARAGKRNNAPAETALTTARSSDSDRPVNPVAPRNVRDDRSWGPDSGVPDRSLGGGDPNFDDVAPAEAPGSGLVDGLVGGVLN